jgi:menaquinone-9 beta-reductase
MAAAGLSRRTLDTALLDRAAAEGADVRRGCVARSFEAGEVRLGDGETVRPDLMFLATGKHDLRGLVRAGGAGAVGLRATLPRSAVRDRALEGMVELHLFEGGYAGLLLQEDGTTNLCISVATARLRSDGAAGLMDALEVEAPLLAERVGGDRPSRWDAIAGVPYGWRARQGRSGLFRIGDQGAVIASLIGDGIGIALATGCSAARVALRHGATAARPWQRRLAERTAFPIGLAERLRGMAERGSGRDRALRALAAAPPLARLLARLVRIG